jgi:putative copper export protein
MPDGPDALSVAFRAVSFVLLLNAAGIPIFISAFGRLMPGSLPEVRQLGVKLSVGALVFVTAHHALEAARMAGEMSGVMDPAMQMTALRSSEGAAFALRMFGLALVAVGLQLGVRSPIHAAVPTATPGGALLLAIAGAILAVYAFTLTGHTSINPHRPAAATLLVIHLLVVAFWLGALWPLYLAATREPPATTTRVIDAFSLVAAWVIPAILLAGVALTALLIPGLSVFQQPYGQLLLAKVSLFAVLMGMASLNKWKFGPACAEGNTRAFKRTVLIEYVLICVVLAITSAMTTFYSPEAA